MNPDIEQLKKDVADLQNQLRTFQTLAQLDPAIQRTIKLIAAVAISEASINDLSDVDISGVADGEVLKYTTSGTDRWINDNDLVV